MFGKYKRETDYEPVLQLLSSFRILFKNMKLIFELSSGKEDFMLVTANSCFKSFTKCKCITGE